MASTFKKQDFTEQKMTGSNLPNSPAYEGAINLDYLRQLENLDRKPKSGLVKRLIDLYLDLAPRALEKLKVSAANNEITLLRREAHNFRSSNGNLGLSKAADILTQIEDENTPSDQYQALLSCLEKEVEWASRELKKYSNII